MPSKYSTGLEDQKFNRTTVKAFAYHRLSGKTYSYYWICLCQCGTWHIANARSLFRGHTQSCGCLNRDPSCKFMKHGHTRRRQTSPEFRSWEKMRNRVTDPSNEWFHRYGGRGILYCEGFKEFTNFFAVLGPRPENKTLDRIDNDGHYSCGVCEECIDSSWPMNVRWATIDEQNGNKQNTIFLTFKEQRLPLFWWAKKVGIPRVRLYDAYCKSEKAALSLLEQLVQ